MITRKMCPYKTKPRHFIELESELDSCNCPTCRKLILISHCLNPSQKNGRKTGGISLHTARDSPEIKDKIIEYVKTHAGKNINEISKALGCSHGKLWYLLQGMDEVVIEKKGRKCIVGVRG